MCSNHGEELKNLCDLHTHLMGTGNADFWINKIILNEAVLPSESGKSDDDFSCHPYIYEVRDSKQYIDDFLGKYRNNRKNFFELRNKYAKRKIEMNMYEAAINLEYHNDIEHTYEIIYDIQSLAKAFGIFKYNMPQKFKKGDYEQNEEMFERDLLEYELLGRLGYLNTLVYDDGNSKTDKIFSYYIIFNAREQYFEIVYGIKNSQLKAYVKSYEKVEALLKNAFSMNANDGLDAKETDLNLYRGNFTPEFYPRRFILKDCIYRQRLDILAYLLYHNIQRYKNNGVIYVEFSVGVGDLSRKWVFKVLTALENKKESEKLFQKYGWFKNILEENHYKKGDKLDFTYKFLAGFSRENVKIKFPDSIKNSKEDDILKRLRYLVIEDYAVTSFKEEYEKEVKKEDSIFEIFLDHLEKLKKSFNYDYKNDFAKWIVGFDLLGDEIGTPYIPFVRDEFINFYNTMKVHNKKFGFRIHCGENVPMIPSYRENYKLFLNHMYITYLGLNRIRKNVKNMRIGHGVAFCIFLISSLAEEGVQHERFDELKKEICGNESIDNFFLKNDIPFEINLTSNEYIIHNHGVRFDEHQNTPLTILRGKNIPFIISTDDDGIWPLDKCYCKKPGKSIKHEFCKAIKLLKDNDINDISKFIDDVKVYMDKHKFTVNEEKENNDERPDNDDRPDNDNDNKSELLVLNKIKQQYIINGTEKDVEKCFFLEEILSKRMNERFKVVFTSNETKTVYFSEKLSDYQDIEILENILELLSKDKYKRIFYFCDDIPIKFLEEIKNINLRERELNIFTLKKEFSYENEEKTIKINKPLKKFEKIVTCCHGECVRAILEFMNTNEKYSMSMDWSNFILPFIDHKIYDEREQKLDKTSVKDEIKLLKDLHNKYKAISNELHSHKEFSSFHHNKDLSDLEKWLKDLMKYKLVPRNYILLEKSIENYSEEALISQVFIKNIKKYLYCTKVTFIEDKRLRAEKYIEFFEITEYNDTIIEMLNKFDNDGYFMLNILRNRYIKYDDEKSNRRLEHIEPHNLPYYYYSEGKSYLQKWKKEKEKSLLEKALDLFKKSVKRGEKYSSNEIGKICLKLKEEEEALKYFKLSGIDDCYGQFKVGLLYEKKKKYKKAYRWLRLSAENGNAYAQFRVGRFYEKGKWVKKSTKEALKWYSLSAKQHYSHALEKLVRFDMGQLDYEESLS